MSKQLGITTVAVGLFLALAGRVAGQWPGPRQDYVFGKL